MAKRYSPALQACSRVCFAALVFLIDATPPLFSLNFELGPFGFANAGRDVVELGEERVLPVSGSSEFGSQGSDGPRWYDKRAHTGVDRGKAMQGCGQGSVEGEVPLLCLDPAVNGPRVYSDRRPWRA